MNNSCVHVYELHKTMWVASLLLECVHVIPVLLNLQQSQCTYGLLVSSQNEHILDSKCLSHNRFEVLIPRLLPLSL